MSFVPKKKRTLCMSGDCEKKYVAKLEIQFERDKVTAKLFGKFCAEHFAKAWVKDFKPFTDAFLEGSRDQHSIPATDK